METKIFLIQKKILFLIVLFFTFISLSISKEYSAADVEKGIIFSIKDVSKYDYTEDIFIYDIKSLKGQGKSLYIFCREPNVSFKFYPIDKPNSGCSKTANSNENNQFINFDLFDCIEDEYDFYSLSYKLSDNNKDNEKKIDFEVLITSRNFYYSKKNISLNINLYPLEKAYILLDIRESNQMTFFYLKQYLGSSNTGIIPSFFKVSSFSLVDFDKYDNFYTKINEIDNLNTIVNGLYVIKLENSNDNKETNGVLYVKSSYDNSKSYDIGDSELVTVSDEYSFQMNNFKDKIIHIQYLTGTLIDVSIKDSTSKLEFDNNLLEIRSSNKDEVHLSAINKNEIGLYIVSILPILENFISIPNQNLKYYLNIFKKEFYIFFELKDYSEEYYEGRIKNIKILNNQSITIDSIWQNIIVNNYEKDFSSILLPFDSLQNVLSSDDIIEEYMNDYEVDRLSDQDSQTYIILRVKYSSSLNDVIKENEVIQTLIKLQSINCYSIFQNTKKIYNLTVSKVSCFIIPNAIDSSFSDFTINIHTSKKGGSLSISSDFLKVYNEKIIDNFSISKDKLYYKAHDYKLIKKRIFLYGDYDGDIIPCIFYYNIYDSKTTDYNGVNYTPDFSFVNGDVIRFTWKNALLNLDNDPIMSYITYYYGVYDFSNPNSYFLDLYKEGFKTYIIGKNELEYRYSFKVNINFYLFACDLRSGRVLKYKSLKNITPMIISFEAKFEYINIPKEVVTDMRSNDEYNYLVKTEYYAVDLSVFNKGYIIIENIEELIVKYDFTSKDRLLLQEKDFSNLKFNNTDIVFNINKEKYDLKSENLLIMSIEKSQTAKKEDFKLLFKVKEIQIEFEDLKKIEFKTREFILFEVDSKSFNSISEFDYCYFVFLNRHSGNTLNISISHDEIPFYVDEKWNNYHSIIPVQEDITQINISKEFLMRKNLKIAIFPNLNKENTFQKRVFFKIIVRKNKIIDLRRKYNENMISLPYMMNINQKMYVLLKKENEFLIYNRVFNGESSFKTIKKHNIAQLISVHTNNHLENEERQFKKHGEIGKISYCILEISAIDNVIGELRIVSISNQSIEEKEKLKGSINIYDFVFKMNEEVSVSQFVNITSFKNKDKIKIKAIPLSISQVDLNFTSKNITHSVNSPIEEIVTYKNSSFNKNLYTIKKSSDMNYNNEEVYVYISIEKEILLEKKSILDINKKALFTLKSKEIGTKVTINKIISLNSNQTSLENKNQKIDLEKFIITTKNKSDIIDFSYSVHSSLKKINEINEEEIIIYDNMIVNESINLNDQKNKRYALDLPRIRQIQSDLFLFIKINIITLEKESIFESYIDTIDYDEHIDDNKPNKKFKIISEIAFDNKLISFRIGNITYIPEEKDFIEGRWHFKMESVQEIFENDQIFIKIEKDENQISIVNLPFLQGKFSIFDEDNNLLQELSTNVNNWKCNYQIPKLTYSFLSPIGIENSEKIWDSSNLNGKSTECFTQIRKIYKEDRLQLISGVAFADDYLIHIKIGSQYFVPKDNTKSQLEILDDNVNKDLKLDRTYQFYIREEIKNGTIFEISALDLIRSTGRGIKAWFSFKDINGQINNIYTNTYDWICNDKQASIGEKGSKQKSKKLKYANLIWEDDVREVNTIVTCKYIYIEPNKRQKEINIKGVGSSINYISIGKNKIIEIPDDTSSNINLDVLADVIEGDSIIISAKEKKGIKSIKLVFLFKENEKIKKIYTDRKNWLCDGKRPTKQEYMNGGYIIDSYAEEIWDQNNSEFIICNTRWNENWDCFLSDI